MPLSEAFYLAPVEIDLAGDCTSSRRLSASPDDVAGRGILATFTFDGAPLDLEGTSVEMVWRFEDGPGNPPVPCEAVDAAAGTFAVRWPEAMCAPGTDSLARLRVTQEGRTYSSPILEVSAQRSLAGPGWR